MLKLLLLVVCFCGFNNAAQAKSKSYVKNLIGEPDYRKVQLHWETDKFNVPAPANFQIRYCELQSWGSQRCRTKLVDDQMNGEGAGMDIDGEDLRVYSTEIVGLRMATTYSFEVKMKSKGTREDRADGDDTNQNIIVIPTKGFSAKATQCLPHASEIEVSTGPHFGGRIAVEAADGERCAIDGEPHSSRDTYTLRINHAECGSAVNETTVATFVLVQENLPILTHSTRRFLVLCTYQPETLTVRAGLNLPNNQKHHGQGQGKVTLEEENSVNDKKSDRGRTGRVLHKPEALVNPNVDKSQRADEDTLYFRVPLIVVFLLMLVGIAVGLMEIVRLRIKARLLKECDTRSIASMSSCNTIA